MENKKLQKKLLSIILGVIGLVLVFFFGRWLSGVLYGGSGDSSSGQVNSGSEIQEVKAAMTEEEIAELFAGMRKSKYTEKEQENPDKPKGSDFIDFESLWEVNDDVYAWITVPGTIIDYPILQDDTDNTYYLNYNIDGTYGYPGCIYTENLNAKDFTDSNTVIYGHNMKNGTMFSDLHKYASKDFFDEYNEVIIYMPDQILYYDIFAAYVYDDRHILYSFDFTDVNIYADYLENIYDIRDMSANINREFTVSSDDKIITLATCIANQDDKRFLVQAVLREE